MNRERQLLRRIRWLTAIVMAGLVISGLTALPLEWELRQGHRWVGSLLPGRPDDPFSVAGWFERVRLGVAEVSQKHPFIWLGTDWLAFAHLVIAISFVGAWRDPVRNRWLFTYGLVACALVVPGAMAFGALRGTPWFWRLIDASFGILGAVPLWYARRHTMELERTLGPPAAPAHR